ncbi:RimJ/RimL family protein N-acetyltransferase [Streptosporangium saharense]|uniref:RimJ/RimL family protein N-acetyltransferase n=2 Tax=Streptosporangium saharense TaxID=1706840 RepID=A0A7W7QNE2_9ACTN|nr:RimJ/RimL family protein N-acetyltransferase [Streptosporangium saharense]
MEPMEITAGALHLRPWNLSEADAAAAALALGDLRIRRWATGLPDGADERVWLAQRALGWSEGSEASFAVTGATGGEVLGHIRVRVGTGAARGRGEVGYWVLPGARGRGVATQALGVVGRWAFGFLGLSRLDLRHATGNVASCRVAAKGGFALTRLLSEPSWVEEEGTEEFHLHTLTPG